MRIWSESEEMAWDKYKTVCVCSQVLLTFPVPSIISPLLTCPCFPLDFQLSLPIAGLPKDIWQPTPSHQLWVRGVALCLSESQHSIPFFLYLSVPCGDLSCKRQTACLFTFISLTHALSCFLCLHTSPLASVCGPLSLSLCMWAIFSGRH